MSLRILFADDSMTAQSMGKKILSDAGYEVVAVSNGAAAVKKIAEQKPDIIILDVYMPGYSGLEVCEKVRGSMDTLKTPVLLTVGKMEPYRAEDGNRVRADGVIVKPFEASDLLAIVKKLEERISRTPARVEQPVLVEHQHQAAVDPTTPEMPVEAAEPSGFSSAQPTVDVPDHMAGDSAFGDLLISEPQSPNGEASVSPPPPSVAEWTAPPPPSPRSAPVTDYEIPVSWREDDTVPEGPPPPFTASAVEPGVIEVPGKPMPPPPAPVVEAVLVQSQAAEPEPAAESAAPAPPPVDSFSYSPQTAAPPATEAYQPPVNARPLHIPVYQEPEAPATSYELMTNTPHVGEIEIPREPQLQETAAETTRKTVVDAVEPGLMTTRQQFEWERDHPAQVEGAAVAPAEPEVHETPAGLQDIPLEIAAHAPPPFPVQETLEAQAPPPVPAQETETPSAPLIEEPAGIVGTTESTLSDNDFESRVAAAMAAYKTSGPDAPLGGSNEPAALSNPPEVLVVTPVGEPAPATESESREPEPEPDMAAHHLQPEAEAAIPEAHVPAFEYHPSVSVPPPVVEPEVVRDETHLNLEPAAAGPAEVAAPTVEAAGESHPFPTSELEAATRTAAAAAGADHEAVAQAVHRVMERLKPELVDEILRELKSKE